MNSISKLDKGSLSLAHRQNPHQHLPIEDFFYTIDFSPIPPEVFLFELEDQRPAEAQFILKILFQQCSEDVKALAKGILGEEKVNMGIGPIWSTMADNYLTFGDLVTASLEHLPATSDLALCLLSLFSGYQPLEVIINSHEERDEEVKICKELGTDFSFGLENVSGNPAPKFHWFFLPQNGDDWIELTDQIGTNEYRLAVRDFDTADFGYYRCHIRHCIPTKIGSDEAEVIPGVWSKTFFVHTEPFSIVLLSETEDEFKQEVIFGETVILESRAKSVEPLEFQWFHNGVLLAGQTEPVLRIQEVQFDHQGDYFCRVSNSKKHKDSSLRNVRVKIPTVKDLETLNYSNEEIKILVQPKLPELSKRVKFAVGDRVTLSIVAVCKYQLRFEWIKQAVYQDLILSPRTASPVTPVIPVGFKSEIYDDIVQVEEKNVSHWIYQCNIFCPRTQARVQSEPLKIPISTYAKEKKGLPSFKIALIICQESFDDTKTFHSLNAPRFDGKELAIKLEEMDFKVMSFVNLTLAQVKSVFEIFRSFIDEGTYALFYYNGHALGHNDDVYLVAKDTVLDPERSNVENQLLWHGELEKLMDERNGLLNVVIYDSCRDRASDAVDELLEQARRKRGRQQITYNSSFVVSYGTRPSMRSYEYSNRDFCIGVYMKHLLPQLADPSHESVGALFAAVTDSFTQKEDHSVASKMTPEYKDRAKQKLKLNAPLQSYRANEKDKRFFSLFRLESIHGMTGESSTVLGISMNPETSKPEWQYGKFKGNLMARIDLAMSMADFQNEAKLEMKLERINSPHSSRLCEDIKFQIVAINSELRQAIPVAEDKPREERCSGGLLVSKGRNNLKGQHSLIVNFPAKGKSAKIDLEDGPIFHQPQPKEDEEDQCQGYVTLGECFIVNTLSLKSALHLKILMYNHDGEQIPCKGLVEIKTPVIQ